MLSNYGYVEEEFFFRGTANTYTTPALGQGAEIATAATPYRSRLIVRRPTQPSRFNGVVIVEWFNVTNGYDTDVLWPCGTANAALRRNDSHCSRHTEPFVRFVVNVDCQKELVDVTVS